jgi:phosphoglucomutase
VTAYYAEHPDPSVAAERVAFGTSGHRGSAYERSFNEAHILAITQSLPGSANNCLGFELCRLAPTS